MQQAPRWLPYRVRNAIDQWRINHALRGLDRTAAMRPVAAEDAHADVFMLMCRRDVRLGVLAIKSLLNVCQDARFAVTVTDDGTLREIDRLWVESHLPSLRWLRMREPAVMASEVVRRSPHLRRLCEDRAFPFVPKLLHPYVFQRTPRVIVLDTDTAFFKPPWAVIEYCTGRTDRPLYMHDHQDEAAAVPAAAKTLFQQFRDSLGDTALAWSLGHWFFNAGFLAFDPAGLDWSLAERFLAWRESQPSDIRGGNTSTWFGDWTREQMAYMVMFGHSRPAPLPLGDDYWLGGAEGRTFNHFLRFYLVRKRCLQMLEQLIARLPQK